MTVFSQQQTPEFTAMASVEEQCGKDDVSFDGNYMGGEKGSTSYKIQEVINRHRASKNTNWSLRVWRFFEDKHSSRAANFYAHARNIMLALSVIAASAESLQ